MSLLSAAFCLTLSPREIISKQYENHLTIYGSDEYVIFLHRLEFQDNVAGMISKESAREKPGPLIVHRQRYYLLRSPVRISRERTGSPFVRRDAAVAGDIRLFHTRNDISTIRNVHLIKTRFFTPFNPPLSRIHDASRGARMRDLPRARRYTLSSRSQFLSKSNRHVPLFDNAIGKKSKCPQIFTQSRFHNLGKATAFA